jgi:Domain of unknown function (DUF4258)
MDWEDQNQTEGDRREPRRFTFLPHALDDMEERNVTEERVRATVEDPDFTGEGDYERLVADRRFGRTVVRVVYNVGSGEYVIVAVMRRRRIGGGGGL